MPENGADASRHFTSSKALSGCRFARAEIETTTPFPRRMLLSIIRCYTSIYQSKAFSLLFSILYHFTRPRTLFRERILIFKMLL